MRAPSRISIGRGVVISKASSGGVIRSRFSASAKNANTSGRGSGRCVVVWRRCVRATGGGEGRGQPAPPAPVPLAVRAASGPLREHDLTAEPGDRDVQLLAVLRHRPPGDGEALLGEEVRQLLVAPMSILPQSFNHPCIKGR